VVASALLPGVAIVGTVTFDLITPVSRMPQFGALEAVSGVASSVGGAPGNGGMTLAKLGVPTFVGGCIGDDHFGRFVRAELATVCDVTGLVVDPAGQTSVTLVMVAPDGERGFLYDAGVNAHYCANHVGIDRLAVAGVRHLHVAYATLLPELCGESLGDLLRSARHAGMTTSIDITWDPTGAWMTTIAAALPDVDLFAPNLAEATALTGCDSAPEAAAALLEAGLRSHVVVTMDEEGSYTAPRYGPAFYTSTPSVDVVDSTGAGDAFVAGWLAASTRGLDVRECAATANVTAACAVTTRRACDGVTSWDQVAELSSQVVHRLG
jgi:sugar/nucleoside kinase (ribokinase family)